jgi:hypothetical protein
MDWKQATPEQIKADIDALLGALPAPLGLDDPVIAELLPHRWPDLPESEEV